MNRMSAHIGYLYADLPLAERLGAAARDGFTALEHPEPWAIPAAEMAARLGDLGLTLSQVTSGMGGPGEKGLAAVPDRQAEFRQGFARALDYALATGCPFVHPMAGTGGDDATYRGNIDWAIRACAGTTVRVLVEAITIPGYHMAHLADAAALQDATGGAIRLLFDSFHARNMGLDPACWLRANVQRIGHVHIADHPGRHEPGSGEIDFRALLGALMDTGYAGAIGFEYLPSAATSLTTAFLPGWAALLSSRAQSDNNDGA